eukprot:TRINITY_DN33539_c0_g1_i1.p1 TRINITY_DN33539_c0_g1~~TRINITY_DN33539_c0_g1_i1.p1  ORF type:complete len:243 (-),score=99.74 TRINITY_DN33539_c0_g1_i1:37-744(-)
MIDRIDPVYLPATTSTLVSAAVLFAMTFLVAHRLIIGIVRPILMKILSCFPNFILILVRLFLNTLVPHIAGGFVILNLYFLNTGSCFLRDVLKPHCPALLEHYNAIPYPEVTTFLTDNTPAIPHAIANCESVILSDNGILLIKAIAGLFIFVVLGFVQSMLASCLMSKKTINKKKQAKKAQKKQAEKKKADKAEAEKKAAAKKEAAKKPVKPVEKKEEKKVSPPPEKKKGKKGKK